MGTLEIRLFGTMHLERDGQALTRFPSKRVKDLFGYLLLSRHSAHSREHLAGLFWGDLDIRKARHSFNTALWRLHRVLSPPDVQGNPYLTVDSQSVAFNEASDFRLDVAEFEARCSWAEQVGRTLPEQQANLYRQAVGLYHGDLMTDCYEDWCLIERERLRRLYLHALSQLFGFHAGREEYEPAIGCAHRLLAADPLREEVHRDLIRLHLRAGQPAAAIRQYRACEAILQRELGIEPMPETQALLREMIGGREAINLVHTPSNRPISDGSPQPVGDSQLTEALHQLHLATRSFDRARDSLLEARTLLADALAVLIGQESTAVPGDQLVMLQQSLTRIVAATDALAAARSLEDDVHR